MSDPALSPDLAPARAPSPAWKKIGLRALIVAVIAAGILTYYAVKDHGRAVDQSALVTSASGSDTCSYSGYEITPYGGKQELVYNCLAGAKAMCVTYVNGIASDSTAAVRAAFASALGGNKPECVTTSS